MKKMFVRRILFFTLIFLGFPAISISQNIKPYGYTEEVDVPPNTLFIEQLSHGDTLKLVYKSSGCFHLSFDSLQIAKNESNYTFIYKSKEHILKEQQILDFRQFEKKLYKITNWGCTTVDDYVFELNGKRFLYRDGTCDFNGFDSILVALKMKIP